MGSETLCNIARKFAGKNIVGEKSSKGFLDMLQYYPEQNPEAFTGCWCAAFVYHCCRLAGMNLPAGTCKTLGTRHFRWFTGVFAWVGWAQSLGFFHKAEGFTPCSGDIVIYNDIVPEPYKQKDSLWCDHIGIVLSCTENTILAAEGNVDNRNVSGIVTRARDEHIGGYIRIPQKNIYDDWPGEPGAVSFREMQNTPQDTARLLEWLSNPSVTRWAWAEGVPWNMEKIQEDFFSKTSPDEEITPCFIEVDNEAVGYIQFYPVHEDSYPFQPPLSYAQFAGGYGVDLLIGYPGLWNKGVGSRIIRQVSEYLFAHKGAKLICADPRRDNPRSVACWEKAGFEPVGVIPDYDEPDKEDVLMVLRNR